MGLAVIVDGVKVQRTHENVDAALHAHFCSLHAFRFGICHYLQKSAFTALLHIRVK
ncbi:hypothetical protein SDC9_172577 [bioreactor metagenome]|uniref:Uncharacterized protein n=1 Tax=bioreactor metagenome TaxID=1076179 RepID=A0A645GGA9_9ZZZZ